MHATRVGPDCLQMLRLPAFGLALRIHIVRRVSPNLQLANMLAAVTTVILQLGCHRGFVLPMTWGVQARSSSLFVRSGRLALRLSPARLGNWHAVLDEYLQSYCE